MLTGGADVAAVAANVADVVDVAPVFLWCSPFILFMPLLSDEHELNTSGGWVWRRDNQGGGATVRVEERRVGNRL